MAAEGPSALDRLTSAEAAASVREAMERLSEGHREIVVLRHFEELSYEEIAEVLQVPQGTVMSRLYRARKALMQVLAKGEVP